MRALTITDVARRPAPGTAVPTNIAFSPDGRTVTYLLARPGSLRQALHAVDVESGRTREIPSPGAEVDEAALSPEEKLRRERARELAVGVTRYAWASRSHRVLVPMADGLWVFDDLDRPARLAVDAASLEWPILDAQISADGSTLGFVAGDEVWVASADGSSAPRQVTRGARGTGRTNGLAEYIAQEEMGRAYGFWLSEDGSRLAFGEVDETHIPTYRIVHQGNDDPGAFEDHRFPFAGEANARVRLGVTSTGDGHEVTPRWLDLGATGIDDDRYLARVDWVGEDLFVQIEDRSQTRLDLVRYTGDGAATLLLAETSDVWINLHDLLRPLPDGGFLWASERSGFRHLEVREPDGTLRHELTSGPDVVTAVHAVTEREIWFTGTGGDARRRQLFRVAVDGSTPPEQVTVVDGTHAAVVHDASGTRVETSQHRSLPPRTRLVRQDADPVVLHEGASDPRVDELALEPPELRTITADDGTTLDVAVFRPDGAGPFPTVIWCYGGPHAQLVAETWTLTAAMRAQYLRQEGFLVAVVDNRGMANRGLAFEGALRHRMGTVEVDDQVRLVEALVDDSLADPARVGIYGWSYGGYLSAMCLARRPDVFVAACAGAPVTSWDGYDTHYTERYMGTPTGNPDGYRGGSVMTHVEGLRDRHLLLVHGLIDENVHFRHTARLVQALVRADIDHELVLYPEERHVPRHEDDRVSMERRIVRFFRDVLLGPDST